MAAALAARVLVVDDDLHIRTFLEDALLEEGYRVATAADGAAALAAALADPPALVVTDLAMPVLDGAGLCRALRADPRTRDIPVLVVTALPPAHAAAALADCPHDRELRKPFNLADLFAAVAALHPAPG